MEFWKQNATKSVVIEGVQIHSNAPLLLSRQRMGVHPHSSKMQLYQPVGEMHSLIALLSWVYWSSVILLD